MPTYQYSCTECGHFFEQFQSFSDASLTTCPECEGRLRKVFNAVGVVFKGSGFYRTDSRQNAGAADGASAGKNGDGKAGGSGESSGAKGDGAGSSGSASDTKSDSGSGSGSTGSKPDSKAGSAA